METKDIIPFPAVTICPRSLPMKNLAKNRELQSKFSGLLALNKELQKLLNKLSGSEEACEKTTADPSSPSFCRAKCKTDENGVETKCINPFAVMNSEFTNFLPIIQGRFQQTASAILIRVLCTSEMFICAGGNVDVLFS